MKKNEPGMQSMKKMKKTQKKREGHIKKRKENKREDDKKLNEVAEELSEIFTYSQLVSGIDGKGSYDVHGYMEKTYFDYDWLIQNMVLDRACWFSKKLNKPEVVKFIRKEDMKDLIPNYIKMSYPVTFENYPNNTFESCYIWDTEEINSSAYWIDDYPWTLNGYDTKVSLGPVGLLLLGWAKPDLPIFIIKYKALKNEILMDNILEAKEINKLLIRTFEIHLRKQNSIIGILSNVILEERSKREMKDKMYDNVLKDIKSGIAYNPDEDLKKYQKPEKIKISKKTKKWIGIIILILVLIGVIFYFGPLIYEFFNPPIQQPILIDNINMNINIFTKFIGN